MIHIPASERGSFDFGWLQTSHVFSFGHFHNPQRMGFGALRVFNDDVVSPGEGFGTHPHANMEIISIPLRGVIHHKDSMGHVQGIHPGEVQIMSAGTGLTHSEYNGSATEKLAFLQIWIVPNKRNVEPRYDQQLIGALPDNTRIPIVGPEHGNAPLWMHQDAELSLMRITSGSVIDFPAPSKGRGTFVYTIEGNLTVNSSEIGERDSFAVTQGETLHGMAKSNAYLVVIDVPVD